jgi:hypothetical protein
VIARLPEPVRDNGKALGDIGTDHEHTVGKRDVGHGQGRAVDPKGFGVGDGGGGHAQAAVIIDVPRPQADAGEFPDQVALFIGHRRSTVDGHCIPAILGLKRLPAAYNIVERLVPARPLQGPSLATAAQHRVRQPFRMMDLLVGHHPLGAQRATVVREVAGFNTDDRATRHLERHAALHPTETAVRRHQVLGETVGLTPVSQRSTTHLQILVKVTAPLESLLVDAHGFPFREIACPGADSMPGHATLAYRWGNAPRDARGSHPGHTAAPDRPVWQ